MKTPSQKAFAVLAANYARLRKKGDIVELVAFSATAAFQAHYAQMNKLHRLKLAQVMSETFAAVNDLTKKPPLPKYSKRGWRWWTPERIEQLRQIDARTGSDEAIARAMGLSYKAAKAARHRHIGPRQVPAMAMAA